MTTRNEKMECGYCKNFIDRAEYRSHVNQCGLSEEEERQQETQPMLKTCPLCKKQVKDLKEHCERCTGEDNPTNDTYQNRHSSPTRQSSTTNNSNQTTMKKCPVCFERFNVDDFNDHIEICANERLPRPIAVETKKCLICFKSVDEDVYTNHLETCAKELIKNKSKVVKQTTESQICSERIDADENERHIDMSDGRSSPPPTTTRNKTKRCPNCSENIHKNDYEDHVASCRLRSSSETTVSKNIKEITQPDLQQHAHESLRRSSADATRRLSKKPDSKSCFRCSSLADHSIPCQSRHIYCRKCLENSMNEHIQSNIPPVCQSVVCDYELSRYDIECLPIGADMIKRLLPLVKTTRRPQCPFCLFYVVYDTMNDLEKHVGSCNPENFMPCEYCYCLYNMHRLEEHTRQCRNISIGKREKALIDFIVPRTKYTVTPQQMRVYLEHRKKARLSLDPHEIVDVLAELDGAFPFEVVTRDCDICTDSYLYDDIFVFGCKESHKSCYDCFANSCKTKMTDNELLTCVMCDYQLHDGEIRELKISDEEKTKYIDYQTTITFRIYTGGQQIIKCPNQECKWIAESQDPNDRFFVQCDLCQYEFCSSCNRQYHYRTTCEQVLEVTQRWTIWCNTERGNYWRARAQQDATYRVQLEAYERRRAANEQRNQELQDRYNELLADEQRKAQNCRLCPHCGRIVERIEGCGSMICGRNYHGGDQQYGCGKAFKWSQAARYVPTNDARPRQVINGISAPEQQKLVIHKAVRCDSCHKEVQGIRFDCIHCKSLIFCETCEQQATLEHSNQLRAQNKGQHVFQIIPRP